MKEFLERNKTTWEFDLERLNKPQIRDYNLFCFGSDKSKNLAVAKKAAESAIDDCFPCVVVTRNPEAWRDIEEKAKAKEYLIQHHSNEECFAVTKEEMRNKIFDLEQTAHNLVKLAICCEPFLVVLKAPAWSDGIDGGTTLCEMLLNFIGDWQDEFPPVRVIIDDADGRTGLFIPNHLFTFNLSYCITMGDQITNRDWREDIQDVICEAYIASRSPALYDAVFDEDADASYERFFNLFPVIVSTGVHKDIVNQMEFFMFRCLTMLPSKKRDLSLPFRVVRDSEYSEERFEKIAQFYEKYLSMSEMDDDFDDDDFDEDDFDEDDFDEDDFDEDDFDEDDD